MERLTWPEEGRMNCRKCPIAGKCSGPVDCKNTAVNRLSKIEDILGDNYDLDRLQVMYNQRVSLREEVAERWNLTKNIPLEQLRELVESMNTGKFISIPCKVGDTVYVITNKGGCLCGEKEIVECEVNTMRVKSDGFTIGYSCQGRYSNGNRYIGNFVFKSIGKTVFLTRKAAEIVLKGDA